MGQQNADTSVDPRQKAIDDKKAKRDALAAELHAAVHRGDMAAAKDLITKQGACEDGADSEGRTPMIIAAIHGNIPMLKMLGWDHDAFAYLADHSGTTPLMIAAKNNDKDMVEALWALGPRPGLQDKNGWTALHFAAQQGSTRLLGPISRNPSKYVLRNHDGAAPLDLAAKGGHVETVQFILEICKKKLKRHHYTLRTPDCAGLTPLHSAVLSGFKECADDLYKADPSAVDICNIKGNTPLSSAASRGDLDMVEMLLTYGANTRTANKKGETALDRASHRRFVEVANLIRQHQENEDKNPKPAPAPKSGNIFTRIFKRS